MAQLTVVQQVADHFLAASADCMVQECATLTITVHEVAPSLVQLLELRAGGRAGLGLLWPSLSSHRNAPQLTGYGLALVCSHTFLPRGRGRSFWSVRLISPGVPRPWSLQFL